MLSVTGVIAESGLALEAGWASAPAEANSIGRVIKEIRPASARMTLLLHSFSVVFRTTLMNLIFGAVSAQKLNNSRHFVVLNGSRMAATSELYVQCCPPHCPA